VFDIWTFILALSGGSTGSGDAYAPYSTPTDLALVATSEITLTANNPEAHCEVVMTDYDIWANGAGSQQSFPGIGSCSLGIVYGSVAHRWSANDGWCLRQTSGGQWTYRFWITNAGDTTPRTTFVTFSATDETPWYQIQDSSPTPVTTIVHIN
jgi:hypothetical protein